MSGDQPKDGNNKPGSEEPFRSCGSCKKRWLTWEDFVHDSGIHLLGLQAVDHLPDANLLVFEHRCGTSVSIKARDLRPHLLPVPENGAGLPRLLDTEECAGHCRLLEDLSECDRPCINARDRRLIGALMELKRGSG